MAHVLIVEDEPLMLSAYERGLGQDGHEIRSVTTLREAKLAVAWGILDICPMWDVCIIDLELQGDIGAGAELFRLLPVCVRPIVVTGHEETDFRRELRRRTEHPSAQGGGLWMRKADIDMRQLRAFVKTAGQR